MRRLVRVISTALAPVGTGTPTLQLQSCFLACFRSLVEDNGGFCSILWCFSSQLLCHAFYPRNSSSSKYRRERDVVWYSKPGTEENLFFCFSLPPPNSSSAEAQGLIITTNITIGHKMTWPLWKRSPRTWLADLSWQCIPQTSWLAFSL